jgi:hypothetical protein
MPSNAWQLPDDITLWSSEAHRIYALDELLRARVIYERIMYGKTAYQIRGSCRHLVRDARAWRDEQESLRITMGRATAFQFCELFEAGAVPLQYSRHLWPKARLGPGDPFTMPPCELPSHLTIEEYSNYWDRIVSQHVTNEPEPPPSHYKLLDFTAIDDETLKMLEQLRLENPKVFRDRWRDLDPQMPLWPRPPKQSLFE